MAAAGTYVELYISASTRLIILTATYHANNTEEAGKVRGLLSINKPVRQSELYKAVHKSLIEGYGLTTPSEAGNVLDINTTNRVTDPTSLTGKALLAEDNLVNQQMGKAILDKLGLEVDIANNGEEALELIRKNAYDIVLMDCQMPVMDGYQATKAVRTLLSNNARRLPIVALTANAMSGDREQCLASGMDDYLPKPYTIKQLQQVLDHWLPPESAQSNIIKQTVQSAPDMDETAIGTTQSSAINPKHIEQLRELDPSGGMGLARRLFQLYMDNSYSMLGQIEQAILKADAEALRKTAHALKSSSANVGADKLSSLFKQLEIMGKESRLDEASTLFETTRLEYKRAGNEILTLLEPAS